MSLNILLVFATKRQMVEEEAIAVPALAFLPAMEADSAKKAQEAIALKPTFGF